METIIFDALSCVLGSELSEDFTKYILSIDNAADLEEYMRNLLDFSNKEHREIYENIKAAKFENQHYGSNSSKTTNNNKSNANNGKISNSVQNGRRPEDVATTSGSGKKKTKKFTKFQLSEFQKGYLKEGRNPCVCQAQDHKLINNCLHCGRIVCEQEGSGPCFYCDNMVCTQEEMEILNSQGKEADILYRSLTDRKKTDNWKKAIENRDKLLEYDRSFVQRTKIIDDEHDYFETNNHWLSKKEKEKAEERLKKATEQKNRSKLDARTITLDLLGKQAVEDTTLSFNYQHEDHNSVETSAEYGHSRQSYIPDLDKILAKLKEERLLSPNPEMQENKVGTKPIETESQRNKKIMMNYIIQDKAFLEMRDLGMCLSMHQPWASLLVLGIKKHEGRSWYTPHRGKLWIAAAAKQPDPEVVKEVETFYKHHYGGKRLPFPETYPTGCLLGYVLLQDVLDQDEYKQEYPNGESDSENVFICSDPIKLKVAIPMKGEHKIFPLKHEVHDLARDALFIRRRGIQNN